MMAPTKPKSTAKPDPTSKAKSTTKAKPNPKTKATTKAKSTKKTIQKSTAAKLVTNRKPRVSKIKNLKSKRSKPNSFWGLPTEIRQHILSYTYTDRDMEKSILRRWGEARFVFGPYFFDTEDLRDRTLLLMDVDPKVKREMEFVRKKWLKRGWELANAKGKGK
ncbi:hypothetical protein BLS_006037 [Venturia inaequalis]|uniref:Uncharacterized protein n=1 Tax=Venturia inaequalis TaxID=5025 RepID=A0A8H3V3J5_VENIN|nr:hypothetical protein BLS_006037 [Venturia inaequalis]KAE9982992.1 hypothetical protein EG328_010377 [Venturia inaequalis]KAE9991532.1 hypothetical protein EG327_011496 [Venturia inaequalis]